MKWCLGIRFSLETNCIPARCIEISFSKLIKSSSVFSCEYTVSMIRCNAVTQSLIDFITELFQSDCDAFCPKLRLSKFTSDGIFCRFIPPIDAHAKKRAGSNLPILKWEQGVISRFFLFFYFFACDINFSIVRAILKISESRGSSSTHRSPLSTYDPTIIVELYHWINFIEWIYPILPHVLTHFLSKMELLLHLCHA